MDPVAIGARGDGRPGGQDEHLGPHEPREARTRPLLRTMLGDVLRRTRLAQGRTLADVARAARVSMPYLSELERGRKEASSEILAAICEALHIGLSDLLAEIQHNLRADRVGAGRVGRAIQADLAGRAERAGLAGGPERAERAGHTEQAERAGHTEQAERAGHTEQAERAGHTEQAERADRAPVVPLDAVRSARISPPVPQTGDVRPAADESDVRPRSGSGDLTCLLAA
jgi:transcriptional regulator with XRE-family HTH domain